MGDELVSAEEARELHAEAVERVAELEALYSTLPAGAGVDLTPLANERYIRDLARTVIAQDERIRNLSAWADSLAEEWQEADARAERAEGERDEARAERDSLRSKLINAGESWTRCMGERDRAEAERDRLARILAVERGDESQAPHGWVRHERWEDWLWDEVSVRPVEVRDRKSGARHAHVWVAYGPGKKVGPQRNTALECMEAVIAEQVADDARESSDD